MGISGIFSNRHVYSNMKNNNIFKQAFCIYDIHKQAYLAMKYVFRQKSWPNIVISGVSSLLRSAIVFNQLFLLTRGSAVSHCHQEVFPHVKFSPRSKHTGKYLQSDILLGKYSQMGIKGKKRKMPVCEDFRFLALLNIYAAVKHAVFRKNFCTPTFTKPFSLWMLWFLLNNWTQTSWNVVCPIKQVWLLSFYLILD